jgi:hypothetical protein
MDNSNNKSNNADPLPPVNNVIKRNRRGRRRGRNRNQNPQTPLQDEVNQMENELQALRVQYEAESRKQELEAELKQVRDKMDTLECNRRKVREEEKEAARKAAEAEKKKAWDFEKHYHIKAVKLMLASVDCIHGKDNKRLLATHVVNYVKNEGKGLMENHCQFRDTFRQKLLEFIRSDDMCEAVDMYKDIFEADDDLRQAVTTMQNLQNQKIGR